MQMVYVLKPEVAESLKAKGYELSKNRALLIDGVFCFEADRKMIELLRSAYNEADYVVDPLLRYGQRIGEN